MKQKTPKYFLALITALTALFLALFGLVFQNIYTTRINRITQYELMGQDIVTAAVSVVFIYIILFKGYQGIKVKIAWLGCVLYLFYIYAYFSFGGITSVFYLLYIAVTGLTVFLFFFILIDIASNDQLPLVTEKYPRQSISIFFLVSILLMVVIEFQELISKTIILKVQLNPFYVFYVLDLAIIFPMIVMSAILNLMKNDWGYLFSGIALLKIVTILPAVIFNDVFHWLFTGNFLDLSFDIIALVIILTASIFLGLYMRTIKDKSILVK